MSKKGGVEMKKIVVFVTAILFIVIFTVPCFAKDDTGGLHQQMSYPDTDTGGGNK
jgi:uncharacterized protein YxeA